MFNVFLFDQEIGTIDNARRGIRFTYNEEALGNARLPALSVSLPKRTDPYSSRYASAFFRNLLPEQSYGRLVASATDAELSDSLGLLGAIGGECPGAVSIWPAGQAPPSQHEYDSLSSSDLEYLFTSRSSDGLGAAIARGRLSLPGVQEKIALLQGEAGSWKLPRGGAVTSHVLKHPSAEFPGLLANELLCMSLARRCDLEVSPVGIAAPGVDVLSVERFDRVAVGASQSAPRQKIHQEDFCQALGIQPERKYEHEGGPGLPRCIDLIRESSSLPADDLPRFILWVGFNYLIGNEDAHAKNLAFLYTPDGLRLTPHYDLVSTLVYPDLTRSMAMQVGRAWEIRNIQRADWKRLAGLARLPQDIVRAKLLRLTDALSESIDEVVEVCRDELRDDPVYAKVRQVVAQQTERIRRELA